MKRIFVILLMVSFIAVNLSYAEVFNIEYTRRGLEKLKATEKSSGKDLWQSENLTQRTKHEGKDFIYIREKGSGIYGKDKKHKSWRWDAYYQMEGKRAIPYQTKLIVKDREGKVIQTVSKFYDTKEKKAVVRINGKDKEFELKEDLVEKEFLGTALQNYPFDEKRDVIFYLLTNEPTLYKITTKYRGEETIMVGEKAVKCHKVQIIPDLGLLNIFSAFVPKTYFWYEIDPPHTFVRYEGLESGLGTPYIVISVSE